MPFGTWKTIQELAIKHERVYFGWNEEEKYYFVISGHYLYQMIEQKNEKPHMYAGLYDHTFFILLP